LRCKGLQQLDDLRSECTAFTPVHRQRAKQTVLAQQWNRQHGAIAAPDQRLSQVRRVARVVDNVADLDRLSSHRKSAQSTFVLSDGHAPQRFDELERQPVGRAQVELLARFVVFPDRSPVHARELGCAGHDSGEHGLEVQSRTDRLSDLT